MRLDQAQRLLAPFGTARDLRPVPSSPRSDVWTAELSGRPVVLKQVAPEHFAREHTALLLAARADPPVVPAVLGSDPDQGVLVLDRIEHAEPAPDWVIGYAEALARLHVTAGPADAGALPDWEPPAESDALAWFRLAEALGAPAGAAVRADVAGILADQPRGTALLHGDPCPGNDLHTASGIRFVDLEQAALGPGAVELAYLRIGFPTCWCVTAVPGKLLREAERAYVRAGGPDPGDLLTACAGWLLRGDALVERALRGARDHLAAVLEADWEWGTVTARERLAHRLGVVSGMCAEHDRFTAFGRHCTALRDRMRARWPGLRRPPARRC